MKVGEGFLEALMDTAQAQKKICHVPPSPLTAAFWLRTPTFLGHWYSNKDNAPVPLYCDPPCLVKPSIITTSTSINLFQLSDTKSRPHRLSSSPRYVNHQDTILSQTRMYGSQVDVGLWKCEVPFKMTCRCIDGSQKMWRSFSAQNGSVDTKNE